MSDDDLFNEADEAAQTYTAADQEADDFLMGGGVPSARFPTIGTVVKGVILSKKKTQQTDMAGKPKFYDDGNEAMQLKVVIQTELREDIQDYKTGVVKIKAADDDGQRAVYIKGQLKAVTADAVKAAGARGLEIGGTLAVKFDSEKPSGKGNPLKQYKVQYRRPGQPAPAKTEPAKAAGGTMTQIRAATKAAKDAAQQQAGPSDIESDDDPGF